MFDLHNVEPIEILMAEDDKSDKIFAEQAFKHTSCQTNLTIVDNGEQLLAYLRQQDPYTDARYPDLILLDINMPRMNGHEALKEIKSDPKLKHIPVIVLSGSNATEDILESYKNYASAYMPKSIGFTEMLDFVKSIENFWFKRVRLPQRQPLN